jgi:hypothetical protein
VELLEVNDAAHSLYTVYVVQAHEINHDKELWQPCQNFEQASSAKQSL